VSTILDALRKVERERDGSSEHQLDAPTLTPEVRRRRNFPVAAIAICALVGFGGGALLSWWMAEEPPVETAALPAPPPPPEIPVPRAPVRAHPKPGAAAPAAAAPAPAAPDNAVPANVAAAPPPAPSEPAPVPDAHPAGGVVVAEKAPEPPAEAAQPPERAPAETLVALAKPPESALEPSPFGAQRGGPREAITSGDTGQATAIGRPPAGGSVAVAPPARPPVAALPEAPRPPATAPAPEPADDEVAAVAPEPPTEPPPAEAPASVQPEPEPEAPAETVFDTGRSPPGAPKVALSFLQWSADPAKRFAFISIDGAPSQRVREGESAAGLTVAAITPGGVQFKREGQTFVIRPRH